MLNSYETLYFQLRKKPHNICDPTSSNHHNSGLLHCKNNFSVISQLRLVGSHNINLGAVASRRLGIVQSPPLNFFYKHFNQQPLILQSRNRAVAGMSWNIWSPVAVKVLWMEHRNKHRSLKINFKTFHIFYSFFFSQSYFLSEHVGAKISQNHHQAAKKLLIEFWLRYFFLQSPFWNTIQGVPPQFPI